MKIIIVDDEIGALHTFLGDVVGRTDAEYRFFKDDEAEILDYVAKNKIAAAFLDISMPSISGFDLAKKLISVASGIKLVFITGMSYNMSDLPDEVRPHTLGFLYKPYDADELCRLISSVGSGSPGLTIRTFGPFECFAGDSAVRFSSQKSKELFALLVAHAGAELSMDDAIACLWPDVPPDKSKPLYRDAVWRLRKTLHEINVDCVDFRRARLFLDRNGINCDFWDFLDGKRPAPAEFMKNYPWAGTFLASRP